MTQRYLRWLVVAAGVTLVVVATFADALRLGGEDYYTFGWAQKTGVVVGCTLVAGVVAHARGLHRSLPGGARVPRPSGWRMPGLRPPAA
jgi:hypothetical protein